MYFQSSTDIVGYTFNGSIYCPDDMRKIVAHAKVGENADLIPGNVTTEDLLREWGTQKGLKYGQEDTYDSSELPKVIFANMVESDDKCEACGESL